MFKRIVIMNRRTVIKMLGATIPALYLSKNSLGMSTWGKVPFNPDWSSLENYRVPDWFRDAKFGIWAHWGLSVNPKEEIGMLGACMRKVLINTNTMLKNMDIHRLLDLKMSSMSGKPKNGIQKRSWIYTKEQGLNTL